MSFASCPPFFSSLLRLPRTSGAPLHQRQTTGAPCSFYLSYTISLAAMALASAMLAYPASSDVCTPFG